MSQFNYFFDEMPTNNSVVKPYFWLIYAESTEGSPFTNGEIKGYEKYSELISYSEEMEIVNKQYAGEGGIQSSNLILEIPKNSVSVAFFNKFFSKSVVSKIEILEIVEANGQLSSRQKLTYSTCKIENYKNRMKTVLLSINYLKRNETFMSYNNNGTRSGQNVC